MPGRSDPVRIPRDSEAIYLLQQARDEAHRFAIGFHRELRGRRMTRGRARRGRRPRAGPSAAARVRARRGAGGAGGLARRSPQARLAAGHRRPGGVRAPARPATLEGRMSTASDPWEHHATWWRETFTNGADLEYELQILPLAASHLAGLERVLDLGCGEGQLARRLAAGRPRTRDRGRPRARRPRSSPARPARPADRVYVRGVGERLPFRDGSFDGVVCCLVIEHATDPDAASRRGGPRVGRRRALPAPRQPPDVPGKRERLRRRPDPGRALLAGRSLPARGRRVRGGRSGCASCVSPTGRCRGT